MSATWSSGQNGPRSRAEKPARRSGSEPAVYADWLSTEMTRQGLTAKELARRAGLTQDGVHGWRSGRRAPGLRARELLARALGSSAPVPDGAPAVESGHE